MAFANRSTQENCFVPSGYQYLEAIGGMHSTRVFRAYDQKQKKSVVIKSANVRFPSMDLRMALRNEYEVMLNIDSPNVVRVLGFVEEDQNVAIIMEYQNIVDLRSLVKSRSLSLQEQIWISIQIFQGIKKIHESGFLHRDLNPSNILIDKETFDVRICDFGLAFPIVQKNQEKTFQPMAGTPGYMSPEQTGRLDLLQDERTDLYCAGASLYYLFTKTDPFEARDLDDFLSQTLTITQRSPKEIIDDIPSEVNYVVMTLMQKEPKNRFQNVPVVLECLALCLANKGWEVKNLGLGISHELKFEFTVSSWNNLPMRWFENQKLEDSSKLLPVVLIGEDMLSRSLFVQNKSKNRPHLHILKYSWNEDSAANTYSGINFILCTLLKIIQMNEPNRLKSWKNQVLMELGSGLDRLIEIFPEIREIFREKSRSTSSADIYISENNNSELTQEVSDNQLNFLLCRFFPFLISEQNPVLLHLENIHLADAHSINFVANMTKSLNLRSFCLVLGFASTFDKKSWKFSQIFQFEEWEKIELPKLNQNDICIIVNEKLNLKQDQLHKFSQILLNHCGSDLSQLKESLESLVEMSLIRLNNREQRWEIDLPEILEAFRKITQNSLPAQILESLNKRAKHVLQIGSAIGFQFYKEELRLISPDSPEELKLGIQHCLSKGLLLQRNVGRVNAKLYEFVNKNIYLEAKKSPFSEDVIRYHEVLYRNNIINLENQTIFDQHRLFNFGRNCFKKLLHEEQEGLLELGNRIAVSLMKSHNYSGSFDIFTFVCSNLKEHHWHNNRIYCWDQEVYRFKSACLSLEVKDEIKQNILERILELAQKKEEKIQILEIRSRHLISQGSFLAALNTLRLALVIAGLKLPNKVNASHVALELVSTKILLGGVKTQSFEKLGLLKNPEIETSLNLLMLMVSPTYFAEPVAFPLLVMKMLKLTSKYGMSDVGCYALCVMGVLECAVFNNIEKGVALSQLGVTIGNQLQNNKTMGKVLMVHYMSVWHWKHPIAQGLPFFLQGYNASLNCGDYEYAALNAAGHCANSFISGQELIKVTNNCKHYEKIIKQFNENSHLRIIKFFEEMTSVLQSSKTELFSESFFVNSSLSRNGGICISVNQQEKTAEAIENVFRMQICYLFGDIPKARSCGQTALKLIDCLVGTGYQPVFAFYFALCHLQLPTKSFKTLDATVSSKFGINTSLAKKWLKKLKFWASFSPSNYQHKADLVEAEVARVEGNFDVALLGYEKAANGASSHGYIQEEALACELMGEFFESRNNRKLTSRCMEDAIACYNRWGAVTKSEHLLQKYAGFVSNHASPHCSTPPATLKTPTPEAVPKLATISNIVQSTQKSILESRRDPNFVSKIAQRLQACLSTSQLIAQTLKLSAEFCGAERTRIVRQDSSHDGFLLLGELDQGRLHVPEFGEHMPNETLPVGLTNYVCHSLESVILSDSQNSPEWSSDPYFSFSKNLSLLAIPLQYQDRNLGVLLLENRNLINVFRQNDIDFSHIMARQLAISLHNASLFEELENKVNLRTMELQKALTELKSAQEENLQREKLSFFGKLVAGVAHEMNTPLGIGILATSRLIFDSDGFKTQLESGIKKSELLDYIDKVKEASFLLETNLTILSQQIIQFKSLSSLSVREIPALFSVSEVIHTAIKGLSVLGEFSNLELSSECPTDLMMDGYRESLLQVLYNLLRNAAQHAFSDRSNGKIKLFCEVRNRKIELRCSDNGQGISKENISKIFDPFFSVKRKSGNMGLGLHLVHNFVVDKMHGTIECESILGEGTTFHLTLPTAVTIEKDGKNV